MSNLGIYGELDVTLARFDRIHHGLVTLHFDSLVLGAMEGPYGDPSQIAGVLRPPGAADRCDCREDLRMHAGPKVRAVAAHAEARQVDAVFIDGQPLQQLVEKYRQLLRVESPRR